MISICCGGVIVQASTLSLLNSACEMERGTTQQGLVDSKPNMLFCTISQQQLASSSTKVSSKFRRRRYDLA